ncbi:P-loop containing nucleoside triphosphate hydrolase [Arabidopsis thaliana x Arabidopsis arenosa]|uniref:P-loop containing nucleoside triphosphate hydrolase n=1 Tax=Arabidopsis thaliana x Arabidopsis arenosa TaxID=1240361 RepID=A0A8T2BXC3_9BRAS|nr:P-loop containing nucleoside triphosphate hydrolase [Arabidopsis thaliana x Arabidopsis arenosa]
MAEGVVFFGVQKLWELLNRESSRLNGIDEQVEGLKRQLGRLQSLLKDADARKHDSERVRNFLEDVKDIVYDAEDVIESFLLKKFKEKEKGIMRQARRLACFLVDRREFASDIEGITKRISEVIEGMQSLGIQQIIDGGRSLCIQDRQREQREIRQTFPNNTESDLVGVEQSVEELVSHLVENDNIQVVSISGMGGIGKTTLARQVFHHDMVRCHFDGFAWVCVSQEFTRKHVWQRILQELRPHDGSILQMDEYTLQGQLFELMETGRYIVVLDDVWKEEDWDLIKPVFPQKRGWKMLLTSRNESVGLHADPTCFAFRPRILTAQESWKLCERIVFPRRDETEFRVDEMEAMGKKMVAYCGGLPLAVKVLGGLLAKKHTVLEWKRVYDNIGTQIVGKSGLDDNNLNSVFRVLSLSYEDLPMCLKHCFLYLAHYPEDYKINVKTLFNFWAAEGIITSFYDGSTIRDSGEGYLEELVRAKGENFLQIIKVPPSTSTINSQSPSRSRRLSIHGGNALQKLGQKNNKKVRSLLFFGDEDDYCIQSAPSFQCLSLLRVLHLSRVKFEEGKMPSSIGELIHLRFLSLYKAGLSHLPSSLRKLKLLYYLNLRVDVASPVHVPNVLKEMQELRYLLLPVSMHDKTKLELGDLVNLEYLWRFSTKHSSVTDLLCMTKLRELNVFITGGCTSETLSSSLHQLRDLEVLSLHDRQETHVAYHRGEIVPDCTHLKDLVLAMHMPRFPDQYRFPPYLAHIWLMHCSMEEDPMPILDKLLYLKSLVLTCGAFVGNRMVCSKGGFPQLCALKLSEHEELEEWIVEEGSMPCLRTLTIDKCRKLKELPEGIKYIISLKELKIKGMKREWTGKLVPGGEDYYRVQHIPSAQFIKCDH